MKTAHDHTGFAEASSNLKAMQAKHDALAQEQQELLAKLRFKEPTDLVVPTQQERALALLSGTPLPGGRTELVDGQHIA